MMNLKKTIECVLFVVLTLCGNDISAVGLNDAPQLKFKNGKLELEGSGELYDFGESQYVKNQHLKRVYYLFADSPDVRISSYTPGSKSPYNKIAFKKSDTVSRWYDGGSRTNNTLFSERDVKYRILHYRWSNRAYVLFDTKNGAKEGMSSNSTVGLVTLPMPKDSVKFKSKLAYDLNGELLLTIKRGKRIVFDSILIDGEKQDDVRYHADRSSRDRPFCNTGKTYARVPIYTHRAKINVTVFYKYLEDGRIDVREETFTMKVPRFQVLPIVIASICLLLVIGLVIFLIKKKSPKKSDPKQLEQARKEIDKIESIKIELEDYKRKINDPRYVKWEKKYKIVSDGLVELCNRLEESGEMNVADKVRVLIKKLNAKLGDPISS